MSNRHMSKSAIDKAGRVLSGREEVTPEQALELEAIFDDFRKSHLHPLSLTTLELQRWLQGYDAKFHIAQRLKRKPQIMRKLRRFSVRLTQLQDIGGARIIVDANRDLDRLLTFLRERFSGHPDFGSLDIIDYRERGREDSGYRAVHLIFQRSGRTIELQLRSRIQHYWAEGIERTSVVYGRYLKELDGDPEVVGYFKSLSDLFYELECGRRPTTNRKLRLAALRDSAERIIQEADTKRVFDSFVNEGIVKTLIQKEKALGDRGLHNWIIVFDWNHGAFVCWDVVTTDPDEAIIKYIEKEHLFPADHGFEVVLIGSSDVASIRETHSHYFGLELHDAVLATLDESIAGFSRKMDIDVGARQVLAYMHRKRYWGNKTVTRDTLRNHFCRNIVGFDSSLEALIERGLVHPQTATGGLALNVGRKGDIERYL